jgi:hypothetical protein
MPEQEVGRFLCAKCGKPIVAAGPLRKAFKGIGSFQGPCPWACGAWIIRGFRFIEAGQVHAYRAPEWEARSPEHAT